MPGSAWERTAIEAPPRLLRYPALAGIVVIYRVNQLCLRGILRIGFFEDFKGGDTILLAGDAQAMEKLTGVLRPLAESNAEGVQLHALPFVRPHRDISILAARRSKSTGLQYAARDAHWRDSSSQSPRPSPRFNWTLSSDDWTDVATRVETLLSSGAGHQYPADHLGTSDDVQLMVSMNEYGDDLWQ